MANYVSQHTGAKLDEAVGEAHDAADFVIEQGDGNTYGAAADYTLETGRWHYRKWNSGILECWTVASYTGVAPSTAWAGGIYAKLLSAPLVYPVPFVGLPALNVSANVYGAWGICILDTSQTNLRPSDVFIWCPSTPTVQSLDMRVNFYAIGRWKA